jgi:hypothetical protein
MPCTSFHTGSKTTGNTLPEYILAIEQASIVIIYGLTQIRNSETPRENLKAHLCVQRVEV